MLVTLTAATGAGANAKKATPGASDLELYNLADDLGKTKNLAAERPEVVRELGRLLATICDSGRSR